MAHKLLVRKGLPQEMGQTLSRLGESIRIASKRREMSMADMSPRMFVTRKTLSRLEKGDLGIS